MLEKCKKYGDEKRWYLEFCKVRDRIELVIISGSVNASFWYYHSLEWQNLIIRLKNCWTREKTWNTKYYASKIM